MNAILPGPPNSKTKHFPAIDMTPMVDLGFLLITFFIFTASINEVKSLRLFMPDTRGSSNVKESHAVTILLGENHVAYYEGFFESAMKSNAILATGFDKSGIRKLLMNKKSKIGQDIVVIVKPSPDCSYADLVNAIDELMITHVDKWLVVEANKNEYAYLKTVSGAQNKEAATH